MIPSLSTGIFAENLWMMMPFLGKCDLCVVGTVIGTNQNALYSHNINNKLKKYLFIHKYYETTHMID